MEILLIIRIVITLLVLYCCFYYRKKSEYWEKIADAEYSQKEFYSKESLDRMEEIFYLRQRIAELTSEVENLKK